MSSSRPRFDKSTASFNYDLGRWPQREWYPIGTDNIAAMTATSAFTLSSGTQIVSESQSFGGGTRFTLENFPTAILNTTDLTLLNEGDSTDFTRLYQIYVPVDAIIKRMTFLLALGLNVSAYTSGNFRLTSLRLGITSYKAAGQTVDVINPAIASSAPSNMTAVDNQILIVKYTIERAMPVYSGGILEIDMDVNTALGVGTYQKGIVDIFPFNTFPTTGARTYGQSGFYIYWEPNPWEGGTAMQITDFAGYP